MNDWESWAARGLHRLQHQSLPPPPPGGRFQADQETGVFRLVDASGKPTVEAGFEVLGTWSVRTESWLWAWANESVVPTRGHRRLLDRARELGLSPLLDGRVPCPDEETAHQIFGVALLLLEAEAWYRFQVSPTSMVYLALHDVRAPEPEATDEEAWFEAIPQVAPAKHVWAAYVQGVWQRYRTTGSVDVLGTVAVRRGATTVEVVTYGAGKPERAFRDVSVVLAMADDAMVPKVRMIGLLNTVLAALFERLATTGSAVVPGLGRFSMGERIVVFEPGPWVAR